MLVNGDNLQLEELSEPKVSALLERFGVDPKAVAIEKNGEILPRSLWDAVVLEADDRIEIIRFVGGG